MTVVLSQEIDLRIELDRRINFAMQQNDVPVIKALTLQNCSEGALRDLQVRITAEPDFAQIWESRIASLEAAAVYRLDAVDLQLSPRFLGEQTEAVRGHLCAEVLSEGKILGRCLEPVELLARDEWGGLSSLPEILAAFVLPNHPLVEQLLRSAATFVAEWTGNPALDGYQSKDRRRVLTLAAAVYGALQKLDLTYISPPSSFEKEGQRVRLPEQILETRMATCLDLALLMAAGLEQAGLHALVVLVRGHAFAGVWLDEDCFPEPAMDDGLRLRKRVALGEIAVFDPTVVTNRPLVPFEQAVSAAKRRLDEITAFCCVIDVKRARKGRIRPLPERAEREALLGGDGASEEAGAGEPQAPDLSQLVAEPASEVQNVETKSETPFTRLDRWRRKLLDLTLRNRLLNFQETKKTLRLLGSDLGGLEDLLAGGAAFQILPTPGDFGASGPRDAVAHLRRTGSEALDELIREDLKACRLYGAVSSEELRRRLVEIYRAARLGLEEGGASALYLALGFLCWYETEQSLQPRLAPILLLPVQLQRKSVTEGFKLRLSDDDPRINITLLEHLKQDFGLVVPDLDPLPEDESGLDVQAIFRTLRQAVRDIDRWEVVEEAQIGLFSFTKFLMWRDLSERADDLMANPVVAHLVNLPGQPFDPDGRFPRPEDLDEERSPSETFCPLPADSSQLAAVLAAAEGRSFVLEGPPGTGKSQTITNLIAHCLTEGKTVLFVSEKMAALNVVYRRLVKVGLGRFCLELHSNKAQKRGVIDQLQQSLERVQTAGSEKWAQEASRLEALRKDLNEYVRALHLKRSTGESVFQATSRLIGLRTRHRVALAWPSCDALDGEALAGLRDLVDRLATAAVTCGEVPGHPWEAASQAHWKPQWEEEVQRQGAALGDAVETLLPLVQAASTSLKLRDNGWSHAELSLLRELTVTIMASPAPPKALLVSPNWSDIESQIGEWIRRGETRDRLRSQLREDFRDEILKLDLEDLRGRVAQAEASWWPASWWRLRPVLKALKGVSLNPQGLRKAGLASSLDLAMALRTEQQHLDRVSDEARSLLGRFWNDGEAQWSEIALVRAWGSELRALAPRAAGENFERAATLREEWARLATEGRELVQPTGRLGRQFLAFREGLDAFEETRARLTELLELDPERAWGVETDPDALGRARSKSVSWQSATPRLRDWCSWRRGRREAVNANLGPLVAALEQGEIQGEELPKVFERSYTQWWLNAVTGQEPVLRQFSSPEHDRKILQFQKVDDRYISLTKQLIQARLAERVPTPGSNVLPTSEMGILKREGAKKRRHLSVRLLLQKIPNLLPRLKPCLLMSPMSVAQYLDANHSLFDVVVFDEASQIPVWDAVGAIARGRQAIIVGDPKQLPPTTFFQRSEAEDEDPEEDQVEDLESILDDCIGAQIPLMPLSWHYRSRHESLITFSNYHYYGNRLLTFPSPATEGVGVTWHPVPDGIYDKGKSRTNRAEAHVVVQEVIRRLKSPDLRDLSIGIVTFSQAQQSLIEDLLDAARLEHPDLDPFFADTQDEPVFVKNLENVQGDERDVILFSICYGPDLTGRVSMNFGPMNRDGGERRLNVAITRARQDVMVFSTLRADQIDLVRTRAQGVRDLKAFLEYAEKGPSALIGAIQADPEADFDSPFEEEVYDALVERGWVVHKQVGSARYRIDLAVVDPRAPGRYLLGVECDGANYHRGKTARDRDKLREGVLGNLGWTLFRIWSTDWWSDPTRQIERLEKALQDALSGEGGESDSNPKEFASLALAAREPEVQPQLPPARLSPAPEPASQGGTPYRPTPDFRVAGSPTSFFQTNDTKAIQRRLIEVVAQEGPIRLELAAKRVATGWGFECIRARTLQRVSDLVPRDEILLQATKAGIFLWLKEMEPARYDGFRVPDEHGEGGRQAEEIPLEEIRNGAAYLLEQQISAPFDDMVRETARLFGFMRLGRLVEERMRLGLESLLDTGMARREGENLSISS